MKKRIRKVWGGLLAAILFANMICPITAAADAQNEDIILENNAQNEDDTEQEVKEQNKTEVEEREASEGEEEEISGEESREESGETPEGDEKEELGEIPEGNEKEELGEISETENGQLLEEDGTEEENIPAGTNGWVLLAGNYYWYVNGERQGTEGSGEELYDPETDAWYWLDANEAGARAVSRDVYIASGTSEGEGRWVRYDENGQMVRGWSEDKIWYFDPVNGAMARGNVVIDGIEYEFDDETGERVTLIGFEEFGFVCNVNTDGEYEYVTRTYGNAILSTIAKVKFAYTTFTEDDNHEAKDGYEWKQTTISLIYDDENALEYGCCWSLLYNLDYYNFMDEPIDDFHTEDIVEDTEKIVFQDAQYDISTNYTVKENWKDENGAAHVVICFECHVPAEYDGMVIALYDTAYSGEEVALLARLNESSLLFRME